MKWSIKRLNMEIYQLYVNKYEFRNHRILHKFFWVWPRLTFHTALGRSNPDMPYISKYQTLPSRNVIMWNLLEIEVSGYSELWAWSHRKRWAWGSGSIERHFLQWLVWIMVQLGQYRRDNRLHPLWVVWHWELGIPTVEHR